MLSELILALDLAVGMWVLAAFALDQYGTRRRPHGAYDLIVVPGCAVRSGGGPSDALRRRAARGAELYAEGLAPMVLLTGGIGRNPPSEAQVAAQICREAGVPEGALILEEESTSTLQNARFAEAVLATQGLRVRRVLVVSDTYHIFRCERIFRRTFGEADGVGVRGPLRIRIWMSLREVGALLAYALRRRAPG